MSIDSQTGNAIYGTAAYTSQHSCKQKLTETDTLITCLKSAWLVSYVLKEDEKKFVVSATMASRYLFPDTRKLYVFLEHKEKELKQMVFKLEKNSKLQEFEVPFVITLETPISEVDVFAIVDTSSFTYFSNTWSTEVSFRHPFRAHDVVIIVDETKFYVHKTYLATWSKYFDRLFFGDFKEKNQQEVKLEEIDAEEFEVVLMLIHPQSNGVLTVANVLQTLKLADRFEIPQLMVRCGDALSQICAHGCAKDTPGTVPLMDCLELGEKHNMIHLQVACFERIHRMPPQDRVKFFDENRDRIRELSEMTVKNMI